MRRHTPYSCGKCRCALYGKTSQTGCKLTFQAIASPLPHTYLVCLVWLQY